MISTSDRWLGIELRHLAALQAIAAEGSFRRAAERLGYTQSAVSQQIAVLERIVGERLIFRPGGPRPVSLTAAGGLLLHHADDVLARMRAAEADVAAVASGQAGTLRVGTYQSAGRCILPPLLREFAGEWPRVSVRLTEHHVDDALLVQVEQGELDLAFAAYPIASGPFESVGLMHDPYVLLAAADSEIAVHGPATLAELQGRPLIGFRTCKSVFVVEQWLRDRGINPNIVFRSDDNGTVQGLVASGMGLAFVPRLSVDAADPTIAVVDIDADIPPRHIALVWHRDRYLSPVMRAFIETAARICREYEERQREPSIGAASLTSVR